VRDIIVYKSMGYGEVLTE